ncbi:MAG: hypothetical protein WBA74_15035 [Cyclobacteriaceae bacterium]
MKYVTLLTGILFIHFSAMTQELEKIIITNSTTDLSEKLNRTTDKNKITRLLILVEENIRDWHVIPSLNGKYQYDNQSHNNEIEIVELPKSIEEFTNLEYLDVSSLGLSGLGTSIPLLKRLRVLNISYNDIFLENEIDNLSNLSKLETIIAFGCDVTEYSVTLLKDRARPVQVLYKISDYLHDSNHYFDWRNKYVTTNKRSKVIKDFLTRIHHFYPIGYPFLQKHYDGYQELKAILKKNAIERQNDYDQNDWKITLNKIRSDYSDLEIHDFTADGSLSEIISVMYEDKTDFGVNKIKYLFIYKSLLTKHFTIFFKTYIIVNEFKKPVNNEIISGINNASPDEVELFNNLLIIIQETYHDFNFVSHDLLMETMIEGGVPYGDEISSRRSKYSIFSYLFGLMLYDNVIVLK